MQPNNATFLIMLKVSPITDACGLVAAVGLPYSGKTGRIEEIARKLSAPIVSPDALRVAMHGQRFLGSAERMVWATAHLMVDALFMAGHQFVMLDATCNTRRRRDDWARHKAYSTWFYVVDTSAEECIERAIAAGDTEIIRQIERMASEHEPLDPGEIEYKSAVALGYLTFTPVERGFPFSAIIETVEH